MDLHAAPGEDGTPELISPRRQNVWISVLVVVAYLALCWNGGSL